MRRTRSALLLSVLVPGLLLVPALSPVSAADPVPVPTPVVQLAVAGVDPAAAAESVDGAPAVRAEDDGSGRRTVLLTTRQATASYGLVGITWDRDAAARVVEGFVRTRTDGAWSPWTSLGGAADEEPDAAEAPGTRDGTSPLWVGQADGVQVRLDLLSGAAPTGLQVSLVDPGASAADDVDLPPAARTGTPEVRTRAQWGADESIRRGTPSYASGLQAVVVHHTASSNDYAPGDVPALLRGFYAYHVKSRGWSDIGYNVLVDRFGTAWEGRAGGLDRAVIGSHAGGFNTGTFGISMIGTYEDVAPSAALLETVASVTAWKAAANGIDPRGSVTMRSGGSTRFDAGQVVTLPTVMGHRQVSTTSCPGVKGFAALPGLRERTAALAGGAAPVAGGLQVVAPSSARAGSTAEVLVRGGTPGAAVEVFFAGRGEQGSVKRRDGVLSGSGTYRTTFPVEDDQVLFAVSEDRATPRVTVRRSPALATAPTSVAAPIGVLGPITAAVGSTVLVTATGPVGSQVSLWFRREGDDQFVRRRAGEFDASGRFTATYVADRPHDYFARTAGAASPQGSTGTGPVPNELDVTAPAAAVPGATVALAVQGAPGAEVAVWFARRGETAFVRRREGVLGPDGMYRTSYVAGEDLTYFATSGTRASARRTTRTGGAPGPAPAAPKVAVEVPRYVDAGTAVPVALTGPAGAEVELWVRRRDAEVWHRARTGRFGTDGRWATSFTGTDDHELWAAAAGTTSGDRAALTVPVVAGPTSAPLGTKVQLTGRARPGDSVVVESRRRGTTAFAARTLTADASGAFTTTYAADDEYEYRPAVGTRVGTLRRTTVAPTAAGPTAARRGTTVVLTGTARPGATVQVLFRREDAPGFDVGGRRSRDLPVYRLGRTLTADASGAWRTSFVLSGQHSWFARSDGNASSPRRTSPA